MANLSEWREERRKMSGADLPLCRPAGVEAPPVPSRPASRTVRFKVVAFRRASGSSARDDRSSSPFTQPYAVRHRFRECMAESRTRQGQTEKTLRDDRHAGGLRPTAISRSEEHTSELQSRENLVCRLLLAKKKYWMIFPLHR